MKKEKIILTVIALSLLVNSAAAAIFNGDFESGLSGWTDNSENGGHVWLLTEGVVPIAGETQDIPFNGIYAVDIRSRHPDAPINSIGVITSDPFTLGGSDVLKWAQLSQSTSVYIELRILSESNSVLTTYVITPATGPDWTTQEFDLSSALSNHIGENIKVEFRQHTTYEGRGYYTLLDDIRTESSTNTNSTSIPEFPTIALPIATVLGIMFLFSRKKNK